MKGHIKLHDHAGNCIAQTKGGFLLPLLASLAGPLLKSLFGQGIHGISHDGNFAPLHSGPMTKEMKHQIANMFQIPQMLSLLGSTGHPGKGAVGFGATGFGLEHGEVSYPGGATGFGAIGFGKTKKPKKVGKGFSVDQSHSKNYSGFPMSSRPQFPVNLAY